MFHGDRQSEFLVEAIQDKNNRSLCLCASRAFKFASKYFAIGELAVENKKLDRTSDIDEIKREIGSCDAFFKSTNEILKASNFSLYPNFDIRKAKIDKFFVVIF